MLFDISNHDLPIFVFQTIKEESFSVGRATSGVDGTTSKASEAAKNIDKKTEDVGKKTDVKKDIPAKDHSVPNKDSKDKVQVTKGDTSDSTKTNIDSSRAADKGAEKTTDKASGKDNNKASDNVVAETPKQRVFKKLLASTKTAETNKEETPGQNQPEDMSKINNTILAATAVKSIGRQNSNSSTTPSLSSSLSTSVGLAEVSLVNLKFPFQSSTMRSLL